MAQQLLRKSKDLSAAALTMVQMFGLSKRQAYRYLSEAQEHVQPLPIPEPKIAFTVKLPQRLVETLHARAQAHNQPLSKLVTEALETFLQQPGGRSG